MAWIPDKDGDGMQGRWYYPFTPWQVHLGVSPCSCPDDYLLAAVGVDARLQGVLRRSMGFRLLEDCRRKPMYSQAAQAGEVTCVTESKMLTDSKGRRYFIKDIFPFSISTHAGTGARHSGFVARVAHSTSTSATARGIFGQYQPDPDTHQQGSGQTATRDWIVLLVYDDSTVDGDLPTTSRFQLIYVMDPTWEGGGRALPGVGQSLPTTEGTPAKNALDGLWQYGWLYLYDRVYTSSPDGIAGWEQSTNGYFPLLTTEAISVWSNERFVYIGSKTGEFRPVTVWFDATGLQNEDSGSSFDSKRSPGWRFEPMGPGIDIPAETLTFLPVDGIADADTGETLTYTDPESFANGAAHHYWMTLYGANANAAVYGSGSAKSGFIGARWRLVDYYRGRYTPVSQMGRRSIALNQALVVRPKCWFDCGVTGGRYLREDGTALPAIAYDLEAMLGYQFGQVLLTQIADNADVTQAPTFEDTDTSMHIVETFPCKGMKVDSANKQKANAISPWMKWYAADIANTGSGRSYDARQPFIALFFNMAATSTWRVDGVQANSMWKAPLRVSQSILREQCRRNHSFTYADDFFTLLVSPADDYTIGQLPAYSHIDEEACPPPTTIYASAFYQGASVVATNKRSESVPLDNEPATNSRESGFVVLQWSTLTGWFPEVFPYSNSYTTKIPLGSAICMREAGDVLFVIGGGRIVQLRRNGIYMQITEYAASSQLSGPWAAASVRGSVVAITTDGVLMLNPNIAEPQRMDTTDRLMRDLWSTGQSEISAAYDAELDAVFVLHPASETALAMFVSRDAMTMFEDMSFVRVVEAQVEGRKRAVFVTGAGRFVFPRVNESDHPNSQNGWRPITTAARVCQTIADYSPLMTVASVALVGTDTEVTISDSRKYFSRDGVLERFGMDPEPGFRSDSWGRYYWNGFRIYNLDGAGAYTSWPIQSARSRSTGEDTIVTFAGDQRAYFTAGDRLTFSPVPMAVLFGPLATNDGTSQGSYRRETDAIHAGVQWLRPLSNATALGVPLFRGGLITYNDLRDNEPLATSGPGLGRWFWHSTNRATGDGVFATDIPNDNRDYNPLDIARMYGALVAGGQIMMPWVRCVIPGLELDLKEVAVRGTLPMTEFCQNPA